MTRITDPAPLEALAVRERHSFRARRLSVSVRESGEVVLTIPRWASRRQAQAFLDDSRAWIARQQERLRRRHELLRCVPPLWDGTPEPLLREWARTRAESLLAAESARLGLRASALRLRDPRTLWGSCGRDGSIMLSWRLVMAPPEVFRYVVIHELCHLRWHSHGPRFWGLVERAMPDYAVHRRWLREHGHRLHAAP